MKAVIQKDVEAILNRVEAALKRARDPYLPPEVRLGALVTVPSDVVLVTIRLAGYDGGFVYHGYNGNSVGAAGLRDDGEGGDT